MIMAMPWPPPTHIVSFNRLIAFSQTVDQGDVLHRFLDGEPGQVVGALSDQRTPVFRVSRGHYARGREADVGIVGSD